MIRTDAMRYFLRKVYDDERRAMLLAHAEEGSLSYCSCCCFIGVATATHPLKGDMSETPASGWEGASHYGKALVLPCAPKAEWEAKLIRGEHGNEGLRDVVIRLVRTLNRWRDDRLERERAELARREAEAHAYEPGEAEPELEMERRG